MRSLQSSLSSDKRGIRACSSDFVERQGVKSLQSRLRGGEEDIRNPRYKSLSPVRPGVSAGYTGESNRKILRHCPLAGQSCEPGPDRLKGELSAIGG